MSFHKGFIFHKCGYIFNLNRSLLIFFFGSGICGGSASGKTTVATKVIEALDVPWVTLLSMDSFYKVSHFINFLNLDLYFFFSLFFYCLYYQSQNQVTSFYYSKLIIGKTWLLSQKYIRTVCTDLLWICLGSCCPMILNTFQWLLRETIVLKRLNMYCF